MNIVKRAHKRFQAKKQSFLAALALCGNMSEAARISKIPREYIYKVLGKDMEFKQQVDDAMEQSFDLMEKEARRRAVEGYEEAVYQGGQQVGSLRRFSDTLLIFLMKGARPRKYRDNFSHEVSGPHGEPIKALVMQADLSKVSVETLEELAKRR